jgi:hypothetical protein
MDGHIRVEVWNCTGDERIYSGNGGRLRRFVLTSQEFLRIQADVRTVPIEEINAVQCDGTLRRWTGWSSGDAAALM